MQTKTTQTAHNKNCEMTANTGGHCDRREIIEMWNEAIRNCNKAAEETGLTVKIQKPNTWQ
jgi:hypothetical protein